MARDENEVECLMLNADIGHQLLSTSERARLLDQMHPDQMDELSNWHSVLSYVFNPLPEPRQAERLRIRTVQASN